MAMASVITVEPQEMECPVCHDEYTDPKILPCAHILCRACIVSWLKSHDDAQCPLCRCAIVDPKERASKSCEDLAELLPTDLSMVALVESAKTLSKNHVCCVCDDVAATSICLECGDMFCQACTKVHQKQSLSRHHTVEELSTMTAERLATSRRTPCATHTNEPSKLFCPTHGIPICMLCATSKHRACPEVTELQERVEGARAVLGELATMLKAGESELERAMNELDEHLKEIEKTTETTLDDIDAACDRLKKSVEECRRRLKELALKAKEDVKVAVKGGKNILQERRGKLTSHRKLVERVQRTAPPVSMDNVKTDLQTRVKALDCSVLLPEDSKPITKPVVKIDQAVLLKLEKKIQNLGEIEITPATVAAMATVLRFHSNHGKNIRLSNNQQTAERIAGRDGGIVISSDEMMVNKLYEVRVDENDPRPTCYLGTGVIIAEPSELTLPASAYRLGAQAVVVKIADVDALGTTIVTDVGKGLAGLPVGSRVGLLVDAFRRLHLFIDGVNQGVAARDIPQPCYAFFDVYGSYKQVTALPMTNIHEIAVCKTS